LDTLSAKVQDYLKAIWTATEWDGDPITTAGLAEHFGTTMATVSSAMRRLAAAGLVEYRPYKPVRLTRTGAEHAMAMVRRHRLLETYLAEQLGYEWTQVHDEAELLEHAVSDLFIARIDDLLGHPEFDPHGDAIDPSKGSADAEPLRVASVGDYRVLRVSDAQVDVLSALGDMGVRPQAHVRVSDTTPVVLQTAKGVFTLSEAEAEAVWVLAAHPKRGGGSSAHGGSGSGNAGSLGGRRSPRR
jgi:DtxR family Mn-dependent transcriptional regulator